MSTLNLGARRLMQWLCVALVAWWSTGGLHAQELPSPEEEPGEVNSLTLGRQPLLHVIENPNERLEMIVNTSRILSLKQQIPKAQVNNPDLLRITPLSPTQVQISAVKPGVTQVNLWAADDQIYSVDVVIYGDAQQLQMLLDMQFRSASLKVVPLANSVIISGHVDRPELVSRILEVAHEFYPKVINNITVGGVQQILLHVKVMEISRTKLRQLGVDWIFLNDDGGFVGSGISGLLRSVGTGTVNPTGGETFAFSLIGNDRFFVMLDALRQNNLAKILAEPDLVTVSGRPASFNVGGEFPVLVPQSLGTVSIEYKKFGTQVDFVPIVMGGGKIRLEVRPRVSEIDNTRSVVINNNNVPALRVREVDTGVEMLAGQTLAIAGLVQVRTEAVNRGLPWVSDLPYVGALFRRVREEVNEIELLILVTPELVSAMNCDEVPPGGPGLNTTRPTDHEFYFKGFLEVPRCDAHGNPLGPNGHLPGPIESGEPGVEELPAPALPATVHPQAIQGRPAAQPTTVRPRPAGRPAVRPTGGDGVLPTPPRDRQNPPKANSGGNNLPAADRNGEPGLIGPIGYDVSK